MYSTAETQFCKHTLALRSTKT
uniref:Uncharacterized protein n=1 Tax=Anguilla anguilla TaxID=7936 RepID=A0A0E9Q538_ANGAN